jgi:hypothetical protein
MVPDSTEAPAVMQPMEGLTPGRIVHFVMPSGEHYASIVTEVLDALQGIVRLTAFYPNEMPRPLAIPVRYSAEKDVATWHWIEKA